MIVPRPSILRAPGLTFPVVLGALLLGVALVASAVRGMVGEVIGVLGVAVGHGSAGVLMYRRSRSLPAIQRRPWRLIAGALAAGSVGVMAVAAMGGNAPVFGPSDAFFLGAYALVIVALGFMARMDPEGPPWGLTMLDAGVGAVAATALVWEFVLGDLGSLRATTFERVGLSMYPILDVGIVVGLCLVALRRSHFRFDIRIVLIAAGMVFQIGADLLYLRDGVQATTFADAQPRLGLFVLASACYLAAAAVVDRSPGRQEFPERETPLLALVWPYLLAAALIPLHLTRVNELVEAPSALQVAGEATRARMVLYALLTVGVLIVVRQVTAIRQNRDHVEQQRRDLISSVSHELRTPLTAIMGFLQMLEEDPEMFSEVERKTIMHEVSGQARHMARTVTDLITLARDGGASLTIRSADISLQSVIDRALHEAEGASVTTDVVDMTLPADPERLEQAIGHLLANGRVYGHGRIHVRTEQGEGTVRIEVHDDGPGIPTRHLSTVWNQFERGTRRFDSTSPGLGMGLAIVRAVSVAHGGTAIYEPSPILGGACFTIVLPHAHPRAVHPMRELTPH